MVEMQTGLAVLEHIMVIKIIFTLNVLDFD